MYLKIAAASFLLLASFNTAQGDACKDINSSCANWAKRGFCENASYKSYMAGNCKKSCKKCPVTVTEETQGNLYQPGLGKLCPKEDVIGTKEKCKAASNQLKGNKNAISDETEANWPSGCYMYQAGSIYFNYHKVGGSQSSANPVCMRSTKVNGGWSKWENSGPCSAACGLGKQIQTRSCTNPAPKNGGTVCSGIKTQTISCKVKECPVNGGWSDWKDSGTCSVTCGEGTKTQTRSCTNPAPKYGGAKCSGAESKKITCKLADCPGKSTFSGRKVVPGPPVASPCEGKTNKAGSCKAWADKNYCKHKTYAIYMKKNCAKACCEKQPSGGKTYPLNEPRCGISSAITGRVVGGTVAKLGKWPWQVAILRKTKKGKTMHCGGSIINKKFILTAAHCFKGEKVTDNPKHYKVQLGTVDLAKTKKEEKNKREFRVKKIMWHKDYVAYRSDQNYEEGETPYDNDIALMELDGEIKAYNKHVNSICLDLSPEDDFKGVEDSDCHVSGWGKTSEFAVKAETIQREAPSPLVDFQVCKNQMDQWYVGITTNMICAGHSKGGIDTCYGDSGGPLSCRKKRSSRFKQQGIVSFGAGCARKNTYGMYTKMSNYKDWIKERMVVA